MFLIKQNPTAKNSEVNVCAPLTHFVLSVYFGNKTTVGIRVSRIDVVVKSFHLWL